MHRYNCNHLCSITNIPIATVINSKEHSVCSDCEFAGPSLWICLYKNCLHVGCGEQAKDHSTIHNTKNPTHCIHINLLSKRLWCYECQTEVFLTSIDSGGSSDHEMENTSTTSSAYNSKYRDSGHGSYSTLRTNSPERCSNVFAFEKTVGLNVGMSGDGSDNSDIDEPSTALTDDRPFGLVGLQNIGNTCYMNAALQALSNAVPLTRFFLECGASVHILSEGKKPGLSRTYQTLIRDIWKKNGGYVTPSGILYGIRSVYPMFRGYYQHDTQEFLRNFMDQLHEELKQIAPPLSDHNVAGNFSPQQHSDSADTFSLAMDEPAALSSSYDSSEGEYETCDSGVSERSSLSDDNERPQHVTAASNNSAKRRLSRSASPGRRIRSKLQNANVVIDSQPGPSTMSNNSTSTSTNKKQQKYRSIISDIFDGKLLSSVQCLTCDRISSRIETFQDLSLPIPSKDHLVVLHGRTSTSNSSPAAGGQTNSSTCSESVLLPVNDGWLSWILAWFKSWFYGPIVTLHDCLAAFFSTDELKGDNMYSCEKCNKLRNGIKFSKVLQLPEVLCIHLKRFRHELMFSSKISSAVSFPLKGLDMRPYLHNDCVSKVTNYELFSVICHYGTAGGGHYISYALNAGQWYEFDDQYVTRVSYEKVQSCEAYVLFYRKTTNSVDEIRNRAISLAKTMDSGEIAYVSKQWLSRFNTCCEPGAIDNSDFLCQHGSIHPDREICFEQLVVQLPLAAYEYLYKKFGGCPPVTSINICPACLAFNKRLLNEMETFVNLTREAQNQQMPTTHLISTNWYNQWEKFVQKRTNDAPGPIDNSKINVDAMCGSGGQDCAEIYESIWLFFYNIYGGGPEIRLKSQQNSNNKMSNSNKLNKSDSKASIHSGDNNNDDNVLVSMKIDKNGYGGGEPMEVEQIEDENDCMNNVCSSNNVVNNNSNLKEKRDEILTNGGLHYNSNMATNKNNIVENGNNDNNVSDDELALNVETKNVKRHYRRRRKALANI